VARESLRYAWRAAVAAFTSARLDSVPHDLPTGPNDVVDDKPSWMSDSPLSPSSFAENDRLDRAGFVAAVVDVLDRAEVSGGSSVFGLIGPWGSGKSSIVSAVAVAVAARSADGRDGPAWIVAKFNPWMYSDAITLHRGFFSELRSAIPAESKWDPIQQRLDTLQKMVTPVSAAVSTVLRGSKDASDSVFSALSISQAKVQEFAEAALRSFDQPILMVIDDLDRLTSAELLEVFKLVRFIGRLPNVYYLLCYDERTLADLLEKTELVGSKNDGRALDYLEKIVQLRFDVPPMRIEHAEAIFSGAMTDLLDRESIVPTEREQARVEQIFASALGSRFITPRVVNKFIGQVEAFLPGVAAEVDWVDFALLSWIRTLEPALYGNLYSHRDFLLGHGRSFVVDEKTSLEEAADRIEKLIADGQVREPNRPGVLKVLSELFPAVKHMHARANVRNASTPAPGRIADANYFDRYFLFGVPADDISDSVVASALVEITNGTASPRTSALTAELVSNTSRTIRKIDAKRVPSPANAEALARWIGQNYPSLREESRGFFSARDVAESYFARLLVEVPLQSAQSLVENLAHTIPGTYLAVEAITLLSAQEVGNQSDVERWRTRGQELVPLLATLVRAALDASDGGVFDVPRDIWVCIWRWGAVDPEGVRAYLRKRIASGWTVLDVVARFVSSGVPIGVPGAIGTITGFESDQVGNLIDLDWAASELSDRLDGAPPLSDSRRLEATPDNRRDYALGILRRRRDTQAIELQEKATAE
jgi:hypothetical protein